MHTSSFFSVVHSTLSQVVQQSSKMCSATTFDSKPFAQGRFRMAYKGTYTDPPKKAGQTCVVKELKDSYTWKPTDWNMTLDIQREAQKLAEGFNQFSSTDHPIHFTDVVVHKVTKSVGRPKLNEYVVVEDFIPGTYKKWVNNYGDISDESKSMPAFAHWSWVHTKGEIMIADLQGVRGDHEYVLTDPVLLSGTVHGKYGCTDTAIEGMAMFFLKHQCNEFCNSLPKPSVHSVGIPQSQITAAFQLLQMLSTSTAYSHEMKFPVHVRESLIPVFKAIASGYRTY